jgi:hypothetical protein
MNNKINMARKKSLKVHKFNRASKIQTNEIVDRVNKIANTDDRLRSKRDLLLSNLKREQLPTKHNILRSPVKPTHVISQQSASESVSISMFNSVLSNLHQCFSRRPNSEASSEANTTATSSQYRLGIPFSNKAH